VCYCGKQGFLRRRREMKLNLSERRWVSLARLYPKKKPEQTTDHKKDKEQLEVKG
jgi:hypothetical protein